MLLILIRAIPVRPVIRAGVQRVKKSRRLFHAFVEAYEFQTKTLSCTVMEGGTEKFGVT